MRATLLATIPVILACGTAQAAEGSYSLACGKEVVSISRAKSKRTDSPFVAKVSYTGKTRIRPNAPGEQGEQRMDDLVITIRGRQMQGGLVQGSTYDASMTYDGAYDRGGEGATTWGYARAFEAFTLMYDGKVYVCAMK